MFSTKPELLIMSGLPASGKSTAAAKWYAEDPDARTVINWDQMRTQRYGEGWKFNRKEEEEMKAASFDIARRALAAGLSVCIDNTNLTPRARGKWEAIAKEFGLVAINEDFDTPVAECIRRDKLRERRVGRAVIERMALFRGYIDWADLEPARDGKDIILVDIDGTVANLDHRLHHVKPKIDPCTQAGFVTHQFENHVCKGCGYQKPRKDWSKFFAEVGNDTPIVETVDLVKYLNIHYYIIFVSGRDTTCAIATEDWLDEHIGPQGYHALFMREAHDTREDFVHKLEILELLPKERIAFVLDDRDQCVRLWREQGLRCLQVAKGDF